MRSVLKIVGINDMCKSPTFFFTHVSLIRSMSSGVTIFIETGVVCLEMDIDILIIMLQ